MKINRIILASILLLAIMTIGAVSATDELTADNATALSSADESDIEITDDTAAGADEKQDLDVEIDFPISYITLTGDTASAYIYSDPDKYTITESDLSIKIDNATHSFTYAEYEMEFNTSDLTVGKHDYEIRFLGTETYNPFTSNGTFEILNYYIEIPSEVTYGSSSSSYIMLETPLSMAGSTLTVTIGDKTLSEKVSDEGYKHGFAPISLYDFNLTGGNHTAIAKLDGETIAEQTISVDYKIPIGDVEITYGEDEVIIGEVNGLNLSNIMVEINGTSEGYGICKKGSRYMLTYITGLSKVRPGSHEIKLTYTGDDFPQREFNGTLNVNAVIEVPYPVTGNSETDAFKLTLPDDAKGTLTIYIKRPDEEWNRTSPQTQVYKTVAITGNVTIPIENLDYGEYDLMVRSTSLKNNGYSIVLESETLIVNPKLTYPTEQIMEGENATVSIDLPGENGTLAVDSLHDRSVEIEKPLVDGKATIQISNLNVGLNHLIATLYLFDGEGQYKTSYRWHFDVSLKPNLTLPSGNATLGDNIYVTVDLAGCNGTLEVAKNAKNKNTSDLVDGKASVLIPKLNTVANITYYVNLTLGQNDDYGRFDGDSYLYTFTLEVLDPSAKPNLTYPTEQVMEGENATVSIDLPGENGTLMVESLDDSSIKHEKTLVDGKAAIQMSDLKAGVNHLSATLTLLNDEGEYKTSYQWYFNVSVKPDLALPSGKVTLGDNIYITVDLAGCNGTLEVGVNEKDKNTADLAGGKASVLIPNLDTLGNIAYYVNLTLGQYDKFGNFDGDSYLYTSSLEVANPTITAANIKVKYDEASSYSVKITDANGKPIQNGTATITIWDGSRLILKENVAVKNGVATLAFRMVDGVKIYKIKTTYKSVSVTKKVIVKNIVFVKNAVIKKSAKKISLQVGLIKVNGKYLKNKKVVVKFNGKKFKAFTNNKGKAWVIIKPKYYSNLKVGQKTNFKIFYGNDMIKTVVKVKK